MSNYYVVKTKDDKFSRYVEFHGYKFSFNKMPKVIFNTKREAEDYRKSFVNYLDDIIDRWVAEKNGYPYEPTKMVKHWCKIREYGYKVVKLAEIE